MAGNKNSGKTKGTRNKQTVAVKQCIINAFQDMGGVRNLVKWAKDNETEFYRLWGRMVPREITGEDGGDMKLKVTLEIVGNNNTDT